MSGNTTSTPVGVRGDPMFRPTRSKSAPGVGVDELRAAWRALEAGLFTDGAAATGQVASGADCSRAGMEGWTPSTGEQVIVVQGSVGSAGATTIALAIATASSEQVRLVECCPTTVSGLVAASTAELGEEDGWRLGRRDGVRIERQATDEPRPPTPLATASDLTVLDLGTSAVAAWPMLPGEPPVLVTRASVPGLRRLEALLDLHPAAVAGLVGPPVKRWPKVLTRTVGVRTIALIDEGRLIDVPFDRALAVTGLTPDPLSVPLVKAGGRILAALGKEPS